MARVKSGVTAKARHKKVLGKAKGYVTVASASVSSALCGSHASMLQPVCTVCRTAVLSTD